MAPLTTNIRRTQKAENVHVLDSPGRERPGPTDAEVITNRSMLRCELVNEICRLEELFSEWKRLWMSDPQAEIFQTPEWAFAWWQCFAQGATLCSLALYAVDELVGIVPLYKRDGAIRFLGTPEADYADIISQ